MERALSACCLAPALWDRYALLVATEGRAAEAAARARGARNCPFSADVWCSYLLAVERGGAAAAAETARGYQSATAALRFLAPAALPRLLLAKLDFERRLLAPPAAGARLAPAAAQQLREAFEGAAALLEGSKEEACVAGLRAIRLYHGDVCSDPRAPRGAARAWARAGARAAAR
jgi:hypothetical protein